MKVNYSYTEEEFRSDLDDKSITTTKKVAYDDYKVLEDLDKIWEISVTLKLKPLPEDEDPKDDEQPAE